MATALNKQSHSALTREEMVKILDLPAAQFRVAGEKMTEAEREELRRVWHEESAEAVADYNRYVEEHGLPLDKYRTF